jgi:hypothetical protein
VYFRPSWAILVRLWAIQEVPPPLSRNQRSVKVTFVTFSVTRPVWCFFAKSKTSVTGTFRIGHISHCRGTSARRNPPWRIFSPPSRFDVLWRFPERWRNQPSVKVTVVTFSVTRPVWCRLAKSKTRVTTLPINPVSLNQRSVQLYHFRVHGLLDAPVPNSELLYQ